MSKINQKLAVSLLALLGGTAWAQMTPIGAWHSIDDATGQPKARVVIAETAGVLNGRIEKVLRKDADPNAVCDKCSDDRKNKPITGMEIIRGMKPDGGSWSGGTILKPDEGKVYKSKMELVENGAKLKVSGCVAFICKSQLWERI